MTTKQILTDLIPQQGILPLYFHREMEVSVEVMKALYRAGIRAVEYTNRGREAFENFLKMREISNAMDSPMYLGIGTIKDGEMAKKYMEAGCDFIVCPGISETVAMVAEEKGILWIPGCMTPTEIMRAGFMGAVIIKIFPGNILGTSFLSSIKPLFPDLLFMPTGGVEVEEESISGWLKAGACAAGIGSNLISGPLMDTRDYQAIERNTQKGLRIFKSLLNSQNGLRGSIQKDFS